jgi:hypothetical protein
MAEAPAKPGSSFQEGRVFKSDQPFFDSDQGLITFDQ